MALLEVRWPLSVPRKPHTDRTPFVLQQPLNRLLTAYDQRFSTSCAKLCRQSDSHAGLLTEALLARQFRLNSSMAPRQQGPAMWAILLVWSSLAVAVSPGAVQPQQQAFGAPLCGDGLHPFHYRLVKRAVRATLQCTVNPSHAHATSMQQLDWLLSAQSSGAPQGSSSPVHGRKLSHALSGLEWSTLRGLLRGSHLPTAPTSTPTSSVGAQVSDASALQHSSTAAAAPPAGRPSTRYSAAPGMVGVYTGWLAQDNLGDEIVADIFLDLLTAALIQASGPETCVSVERASQQLASEGWRGCTLAANSSCDFAVMGGGSTVSVDYMKRVEAIMKARRPVMLFGSGYQSGFRQREWVKSKYFRMLCQSWLIGGVRGPFTRDPLYHMPQDGSNTTHLEQQLQQHLLAGRHILVVTLKQDFLPVLNVTMHKLLTTRRFAIVLQAVDHSSAELHLSYQAKINRNLPPGAAPVMVHSEYRDWAAVLDLYHYASASLNSRLHSGVLSASALRPTLYVAKNTKFADFGASLSAGRREANLAALAATLDTNEDLMKSVLVAVNRTSLAQRRLGNLQQDTLRKYGAAMAEFVRHLEKRDPKRFKAMMCCKDLRVVRSTPFDKRQLIQIYCAQPV